MTLGETLPCEGVADVRAAEHSAFHACSVDLFGCSLRDGRVLWPLVQSP